MAILAVLLAWTFVTGGQAFASGPASTMAQLAALPILAWAVWRWPARTGGGIQRAATALLVCIVATIALSQLPLPMEVWDAVSARALLHADMAAVGVTEWMPRWSLTPEASEGALWKVLPAAAIFVGVASLSRRSVRLLLLVFVGLAMASLLLGALQMMMPGAAWLNPAPQWAPMWNGVFSNPNHQATSLVLALIVAASFSLGRPVAAWRGASARAWFLPVLGMIACPAIVLTGSRAGMMMAAGVLVLIWTLRRWPDRAPRAAAGSGVGLRTLLPAAGIVALVILALLPMIEHADAVRWSLITTTARLAWAHAPWGAGAGAFVPVFQAAAPPSLMQWEYFNHSQNEYVQWALELGVLGVCWIGAAAVILMRCFPASHRADDVRRTDEMAIAAWIGCATLMVDCLVEYPLRTPALMCVGALFAGAMVAGSGLRDKEIDDVGEA